MTEISIERYAQKVQEAAKKYPGAKITSVGFGAVDRQWVYFLFMKKGEVEIKVTIPAEEE